MFVKRLKKARSIGSEIPSFTTKKVKKKKFFKKPGEHTLKKRRGISTQLLYGNLLRDKKYIQFVYDLKTHQLKNYLKKCFKSKKNIFSNFYDMLELRLDNIVFKSGLAKTIPMAKQLINHGNILVNKKKILYPGFQCQCLDSIESLFPYSRPVKNEFIITKDRQKKIVSLPSTTQLFKYNSFLRTKLKGTIDFLR